MVVLLGVTAGVGWWGVASLGDGVKVLIEEDAAIAEAAASAQSSAEAMRRYEKDILLNISNPEKIKKYTLKWNSEHQVFLSSLDQMEHSFTGSNLDDLKRVHAIRVGLDYYRDGFLSVLADIRQGRIQDSSAGNLAMEPFKENGARLLVTETEKIADVYNDKVLQAKNSYPRLVQTIRNTLLFVMGVALIFSLVLPPVLIGNISGPTIYLTQAAQKLAEGDLNQDIRVFGNNEQTQLASAFRNMSETTRAMANHARIVASGDFSHSIAPRGPHDELATSLNQMTESLAEIQAQNQARSWIDAGRNLLSSNIEEKESLAELAAGITESLAGHLDAQAGLLYLPYDHNSFLVEGSFGVSETVSLTISCEHGEGLVGQAIKDRQARVMENNDDSDLMITSGMGIMAPKCLIAFPLVYNNEISGALEFALNRASAPRDLEFLELVSNSISVTLARVVSQEKSQELLKVTSSQAKALERHRQELSQKADDLAVASENKSRFLANMSHDLRSPMNSIMILSSLMKESELSPDVIIEHADTIQNCGNELLQLIDDILDLSKVEAGQLEFHEEAVNLSSLCKTIDATMGPVARQKGLDFMVEHPFAGRDTVTSDPKRILQVVRNLVSNAIKFTARGTVSVSVGPAADQPATLEISVSDTGIGIPLERQEIIFEEFRQAEKGTDRVYGGTGLGLSISQKMAHGLNGTLGLVSTPGQGSTFTLQIPWVQTAPSEPEAEAILIETAVIEVAAENPAPKPAFNGCRALVMGPDMRRLFSVVSHMEDCGCEVEAVSSLDQALENLANDEGLNLLVLDHPHDEVDHDSLGQLVDGVHEKNIPMVVRGPQKTAQILAHHSDLVSVGFLDENLPLKDILQFQNSAPEVLLV